MRFPWPRRGGDKKRGGSGPDHESPLLEPGSPQTMHSHSGHTLKAYARAPLRDDMFNPPEQARIFYMTQPSL
jgi:hypothetical protein